ncbi:MAG: UDP-N-acetylglucosamine 2-epimerase (non-hydrolyzing) [Methanobacteriota archaeon]|nr:MAG: UDP-N-acetylglucosamine 2-epimerase (non-hydrolyzing) [Euryarchaeota archaeon]
MTVSVVVGTRPEIIKMAPVYFALRKARLRPVLLHSGQHYDYEMSQKFFDELGLPEPDAFLGIGSGRPGKQTADAIDKFEQEFANSSPDCVLVEGDTNTVLGGAIAAMKVGVLLGHVEAGLRSYDLRMPEELNRRLADHASNYLFAPTHDSVRILKGENVWGKVFRTGNTVIDATMRYMPKAERKSSIINRIGVDEFALATFHRAENVDDPAILRSIVDVLMNSPVPMVLPLHPRTDARLREESLKKTVEQSDNVVLLPPVGYFDMLALMKKSAFIITDSGGIQEEATSPAVRKRVFVMRKSTERPEAVRAGYCKVVGTNSEPVLRALRLYTKNPKTPALPSPYGKGDAGERIASLLKKNI